MRILVGGWFSLPRLGRDSFALLMKQGVVYDKDMGFKLDSATDLQAAVRTVSAATGEEVELVLRCFVCVPGQTLVIGDNKQIRNLRPMDRSAGFSGLGKVERTFSRSFKGNLLRIKATGLLPIDITPEHPVLVSTSTTSRIGRYRKQNVAFSKLHWKEANSLTRKKVGVDGDYLLIPRLPGSNGDTRISLREFTNENGRRVCASKHVPLELPLNSDTAWLVGMYIAEGFPSGTGACFSLNHDEKEIHQRIMQVGKAIGYTPGKYRMPTSTVMMIPSRILSRALAFWCGKGARNKRIPDFLLFHKDAGILRSLLDGYASGDGYCSEGITFMSTSSKLLALQIQLLGARLGEFIGIGRAKSGSSVIDGRKITGSPEGKYVLELRPRSKQSFARVTDLGILTPVREIESVPFDGKVYNIETSDNTYLVSNSLVHNCGKEACPGCPYLATCDRANFSTFCLCANHSPDKSVFELYTKTFDSELRS